MRICFCLLVAFFILLEIVFFFFDGKVVLEMSSKKNLETDLYYHMLIFSLLCLSTFFFFNPGAILTEKDIEIKRSSFDPGITESKVFTITKEILMAALFFLHPFILRCAFMF